MRNVQTTLLRNHNIPHKVCQPPSAVKAALHNWTDCNYTIAMRLQFTVHKNGYNIITHNTYVGEQRALKRVPITFY